MSERVQVTLQVLVVVGVLAAAIAGMAASVASQPLEIAERTIAPPDASLIASTVGTPSPTPEPTPTTPLVTLPPATPTPTPVPLQLAAYSLNGRAYTTVDAPVNAVFLAPFKARVQVVYYQLIDGEFYTGTDLADRPHYPYVNLFTDDGRVMKFRPGADRTDVEILVRSSDVSEGDPLFRVAGLGPSSWHDRYDATVTAQIVVSLETTASVDLDAKPLIRAR